MSKETYYRKVDASKELPTKNGYYPMSFMVNNFEIWDTSYWDGSDWRVWDDTVEYCPPAVHWLKEVTITEEEIIGIMVKNSHEYKSDIKEGVFAVFPLVYDKVAKAILSKLIGE